MRYQAKMLAVAFLFIGAGVASAAAPVTNSGSGSSSNVTSNTNNPNNPANQNNPNANSYTNGYYDSYKFRGVLSGGTNCTGAGQMHVNITPASGISPTPPTPSGMLPGTAATITPPPRHIGPPTVASPNYESWAGPSTNPPVYGSWPGQLVKSGNSAAPKPEIAAAPQAQPIEALNSTCTTQPDGPINVN